MERALIHLSAAEFIDAYDAIPESIKLAKELAIEAGVSQQLKYAVRDINKISLEENRYDFIVAKMSLHHFEDFDHIYQQIARYLLLTRNKTVSKSASVIFTNPMGNLG